MKTLERERQKRERERERERKPEEGLLLWKANPSALQRHRKGMLCGSCLCNAVMYVSVGRDGSELSELSGVRGALTERDREG